MSLYMLPNAYPMNRFILFAVLLIAASFLASARTPITKQFNQQSSLLFIENKGQIADQNGKQRKDINFKLEASGMNVFIGNGAIHYQWSRSEGNKLMGQKDNKEASVLFPDANVEAHAMNTETYRL